MTKKAPVDLSALKANVETYEQELQQVRELQQFSGSWQESLKSAGDVDSRDVASAIGFVSFLQLLSRRIDLMEKYEAAQRNYIKALEDKLRNLEKSAPKYNLGIDR